MPTAPCSYCRKRSYLSTRRMIATTNSARRCRALFRLRQPPNPSHKTGAEMELQKIAVKIFTEGPNSVPLSDFIDVFHGWIQSTDGVYHDVADYSHMRAGPGVVLIANSANVGIDESDNRRGLLFTQKTQVDGSNF